MVSPVNSTPAVLFTANDVEVKKPTMEKHGDKKVYTAVAKTGKFPHFEVAVSLEVKKKHGKTKESDKVKINECMKKSKGSETVASQLHVKDIMIEKARQAIDAFRAEKAAKKEKALEAKAQKKADKQAKKSEKKAAEKAKKAEKKEKSHKSDKKHEKKSHGHKHKDGHDDIVICLKGKEVKVLKKKHK
jgi:hypothetical protein